MYLKSRNVRQEKSVRAPSPVRVSNFREKIFKFGLDEMRLNRKSISIPGDKLAGYFWVNT